MSNSRFLLDANCFITPCNNYYPFQYVPAYWEALICAHITNSVFTLQEVKEEVSQKEDSIRDWIGADDFPVSFIKSTDTKSLNKYAEIARWTQVHPKYSSAEKNKFVTNTTDGFLVAYAHTHKMILVSEEKFISDPNTTKIKIPNLCQQFGVECINVFEMLKRLQVRFILEKH